MRFAHRRCKDREAPLTATSDARGLREENRTLYRVINLVASSIELGPMLQGIVDLATEATDCHACFIYLLEDGLLTIRAASPCTAKMSSRGRSSEPDQR